MKKHSIKSSFSKPLFALVALFLCSAAAMPAQVADFADAGALKKAFKPSFESGDGQLTIQEGAINYTVEEPTKKDFQYLNFQPARLRASQDFTITGTFKNDAIPESAKELASVGIEVYQAQDLSNRVAATLSAARLNGFFSRTVFTQVVKGGEPVDSSYTEDLRVPVEVTFKLVYTAPEKVFSVFYDADEGDAVDWQAVGSFGVAGTGGDSGNANWKMRSSEKFLVYIYGYSENLQIFEGDVAATALSLEIN
jgi:hypothetical protein